MAWPLNEKVFFLANTTKTLEIDQLKLKRGSRKKKKKKKKKDMWPDQDKGPTNILIMLNIVSKCCLDHVNILMISK